MGPSFGLGFLDGLDVAETATESPLFHFDGGLAKRLPVWRCTQFGPLFGEMVAAVGSVVQVDVHGMLQQGRHGFFDKRKAFILLFFLFFGFFLFGVFLFDVFYLLMETNMPLVVLVF